MTPGCLSRISRSAGVPFLLVVLLAVSAAGSFAQMPRNSILAASPDSALTATIASLPGEQLRLEESALVRIDGNRVVIERLSIAIERR